MQSGAFGVNLITCSTLRKSCIGQVYQVRNHVKKHPWRFNRTRAECYLDPTKTPYTDRYNINEFKSSTKVKKPWMLVIPKDKDNRFNKYKWHEAYTSDPLEAKETAFRRLQSFSDSVETRGESRECKPYDPPTDAQERIIALYKNLQSNEIITDDSTIEAIMESNLNDNIVLKFNLISKCMEEFDHDLPSSCLNDIQTIRDLVEYYLTPVRGADPYQALLAKSDALPVNLSIIPEATRYNVESDETFGGYNALPGTISKVPGLRGSRKYPILNQDEFQWPDI